MVDWKWREFVEDVDSRGSSARLNMVIGILVGSLVILTWPMLYRTPCGKDLAQFCAVPLPGEIFAAFLLATGGVYGFSKWQESGVQRAQIKADSPNPPPAAPAPALGPTTIINTGALPETKKDNDNANS